MISSYFKDRPSLLQDRDDAKLLLGIASASRKALIGEYMTSHQIYDRAVSIAETQRLGCAKVLERINASNEILDKILKLIQESGLSEAFEDPIQCLNIKRGLHLSSSDLALPTPYQGNVSRILY